MLTHIQVFNYTVSVAGLPPWVPWRSLTRKRQAKQRNVLLELVLGSQTRKKDPGTLVVWAGTRAWFVLSADITPVASKGRSRKNKNKQTAFSFGF